MKLFTLCTFLILFEMNLFAQDTTSTNLVDTLNKQEEKFYVVEETANFPGGMGGFYKYVSKNLNYPKTARRNGISGNIYVEFIINKDGSIDDESVRAVPPDELTKMHFNRGSISNQECELEAVRLLKECPNWNPGMQRGQPVKQKMIVPIMFRL